MGKSNVPQLVAWVITLIVMGLFAGVAVQHAWTINASGTVVYLFQNGLIHSKGAQPTLLFWLQIASGEFFQARQYNPAKLVMKTFDRQALTLHSLQDLSELANRVQQALAHRPLPRQ
jgi:hypothetical protein